MSLIKIQSKVFRVLDRDCIGRDCLQLGDFTSQSGVTPCCLHRAYHGCPTPLPARWKEREVANKKLGMKNV